MDYIKNLDSCKYVMSLDMLDLALLPYSSWCSKPKVPLWSANNWNLNTTDYFEFEIKQKTEATIFSEEDSKTNIDATNYQPDLNHLSSDSTPKTIPRDAELTTCHICDLDVPTAYVDDHENSLKHKAYLKIANVVLERTRRHMVRKSNGYVRKNNSSFFCGPCASEVLVVDRANHEKSKAHKHSVSLDRVLYELVGLYTHEENEFDEDLNTVNNKSVDNNEYKTKVSETVDNKVVISDIRARLDELETKTIESYVKMIDEFNEDKVYVLSTVGNDLKISADDYEIIVAEDNFNGFVRVDENFILCLVCKTVIGEEKAHKVSDGHVKNIATPFKDHHCIRSLGHKSNHCVICNKAVDNTDLHVLCDNTHTELLKKALVFKKNKDNKQKYIVEESQCSEDSVVEKNEPINKESKEQYSNASVEKPSELSNHVLEIKKTEEKIPNNGDLSHSVHNGVGEDSNSHNTNGNRLLQSIIATKTSPTTPFVIDPDNSTYLCPACNIEIHVNNVDSHVNGTKHAFNSKSELHYFMQDVGSPNLLCRVCSTYTADDVNEIKAHVTTMDHVNKHKSMLYDNYMINQNGNFYCKPCDVVVLKMNEFYHMEKIKHEANLSAFKEPVNTEEQKAVVQEPVSNPKPTDIIPSHFCDVCQVYIPNNTTNIISHNNGTRHKKNFLKLEEVETENSSSTDESSNMNYHMDATENEKTVTCKVCRVAIPNKDDSILQHVVGKKHESTLIGIITANHMVIREDGYFCSLCKITVKTFSLFKHLDEVRHKVLVVLDQEPEDTVTLPTQATHIQSDNENDKAIDLKAKYMTFKYHFIETDDRVWLKCIICFDTDTLNTEEAVVNHVAKQKHVDNYKNLMSDNLIMEMDQGGYFCAICVCLVPLKGEIHHSKGTRHSGNFMKITSKTNCDLCNVSEQDMTQHIRSKEHQFKIMNNQPLVYYCKFCKVLMLISKAEEHANNCHRFAVKDKICFCTICDPYLPGTSRRKFQ